VGLEERVGFDDFGADGALDGRFDIGFLTRCYAEWYRLAWTAAHVSEIRTDSFLNMIAVVEGAWRLYVRVVMFLFLEVVVWAARNPRNGGARGGLFDACHAASDQSQERKVR